MFFLVELLKYIPELLLGFKMSARKGRKSYDKPSQNVTRYMSSLIAKQSYMVKGKMDCVLFNAT